MFFPNYHFLDGGIDLAISKTGHSLRKESTIFEYIEQCQATNIIAEKTYNECEMPTKNVYPPTCDSFMNDDNRDQVTAIVTSLCNQRFNMVESHLRHLCFDLFANFLRVVEEFDAEVKVGNGEKPNIVIEEVYRTASRFGVKPETLKVGF